MRRGRHRIAIAALAAGFAMLAAAVGGLASTGDRSVAEPPVARPLQVAEAGGHGRAGGGRAPTHRAAVVRRMPRPVRIAIPAIGVERRHHPARP